MRAGKVIPSALERSRKEYVMADPVLGTPDSSITPITELADARVISMLSTEHWNLLTNRSLAYNEAFTRGGMFLTFLSMSFVGLALLAQATGFDSGFLTVAAIVLAFDLVVGLTTYGRIMGANEDDLRAVHAMARIRHAYVQLAPGIDRFLTSPTHDDIPAVVAAYGPGPQTLLSTISYGLTTSLGMIGMIVSMLAGVLAGVLALAVGATSGVVVMLIGIGAAAFVFIGLLALTLQRVPRSQAALGVRFPTPDPDAGTRPD
jgi:hypothetical protein